MEWCFIDSQLPSGLIAAPAIFSAVASLCNGSYSCSHCWDPNHLQQQPCTSSPRSATECKAPSVSRMDMSLDDHPNWWNAWTALHLWHQPCTRSPRSALCQPWGCNRWSPWPTEGSVLEWTACVNHGDCYWGPLQTGEMYVCHLVLGALHTQYPLKVRSPCSVLYHSNTAYNCATSHGAPSASWSSTSRWRARTAMAEKWLINIFINSLYIGLHFCSVYCLLDV